jgi:hypothetical protein
VDRRASIPGKFSYRLSFEDVFTGFAGDAEDELASSASMSEAPGFNAAAALAKFGSILGPPSPMS